MNLIGHAWSPIILKTQEWPYAYIPVLPILESENTRAKNPSTRSILRKEWRGKKFSQTLLILEFLKVKANG